MAMVGAASVANKYKGLIEIAGCFCIELTNHVGDVRIGASL